MVRNMGDQELAEFDPSLGNLSTQMRRLNFDRWFATLQHVLRVLYLMCRRVQNIQEVILDNIEHFLEILARRPTQNQEVTEESVFHEKLYLNLDLKGIPVVGGG